MRIYVTPAAARRALKDHIATHIRKTGGDSGQLHKQFYFWRLIARIFTTDPHGWVLKGGQAMLMRYPKARHSLDIDLYRASTADSVEAVSALVAAAKTDLDDYLGFQLRSSEQRSNELARLFFTVSFGGPDVDKFHVDVVVGAPPMGEPSTVKLQAPIAIEWPAQWPIVRLYPLTDHVSDKICAMYERRGDIASTRWRDLVDLLLIAINEDLDGRAIQHALRAQQDRRRAQGIQLDLPTTFHVPDSTTWPDGYQREAANVAALEPWRTIKDATPFANTFLNPLLGAGDPGRWISATRMWLRDSSDTPIG